MAKWIHRLGRMQDREILQLPLADLGLSLRGSKHHEICQKLNQDLLDRGLKLKSNFWISTSFFVPDGMTGIALPFYLFHPRLKRLERDLIGHVEGGTVAEFKKLVRHEMGHAVDNAYLLRRKKLRQEIFGLSSTKYDWYYEQKPYSRSFVRHIEDGYAQSHPDEDFAETFAVWLQSKTAWRKKYEGWPALEKLDYIDSVMAELKGKRPAKKTQSTYEEIKSLQITVADYYKEKLKYLRIREKNSMDFRLQSVFSAKAGDSAEVFVRHIGQSAVRRVAENTGMYQYKVKEVMKDVINRCQHLNLTAPKRRNRVLENQFLGLLEFETRRYQRRGLYRKAR